MEERKKSRFFQLYFNLIELGCTLKKVGLAISQIFIALDFTSALILILNNFPEKKKTKTKIHVLNKQLVEAQILSEILIRDDTAVLLIRVIGLSEVQFQCKIL